MAPRAVLSTVAAMVTMVAAIVLFAYTARRENRLAQAYRSVQRISSLRGSGLRTDRRAGTVASFAAKPPRKPSEAAIIAGVGEGQEISDFSCHDFGGGHEVEEEWEDPCDQEVEVERALEAERLLHVLTGVQMFTLIPTRRLSFRLSLTPFSADME
eukprot:508140-Amorphochlora_amoeboformis.AAC.2